MNISIIIPTFQCEKFIARAVRSALSQNYPKDLYEIIVVDDGSTDNTSIILEAFESDIRVIKHKKNMGLSAARNSGLKKARGRYAINLDADDYMHKDLLNVGSLYLDLNPAFDAVAFDYLVVDDNEKHICRVSAQETPIACGVFFRMEQLIDIGLYDENFLAREDEDLRIRFLKKYNIEYVHLPLYRYRKHENNLTNNSELMHNYLQELKAKHEDNNETN